MTDQGKRRVTVWCLRWTRGRRVEKGQGNRFNDISVIFSFFLTTVSTVYGTDTTSTLGLRSARGPRCEISAGVGFGIPTTRETVTRTRGAHSAVFQEGGELPYIAYI